MKRRYKLAMGSIVLGVAAWLAGLRRFAPTLLALAIAAVSLRAAADDTQTLSLRDGTSVTGVVVEYIEGDRVTLRLPNGDTRRIAWADLALVPSAPPIVTLPLAPPRPSPYHAREAPPATPDEHELSGASLAFGVQGALNSPLGPLALAVDYFPWPWVGVEGLVAMPVGPEPVTLGENVVVELKFGGGFGMGLGVGFAQAFTKAADSGDHPGVTSYFTADCSHISFEVTPHLVLRATLGLAYALNNGDYCSAHPDSCPRVGEVPVTGIFSALWGFDLGGGG